MAGSPAAGLGKAGPVKRLGCLDTLHRITRDGMSVARFGDGECRMAFSEKPLEFQRWSPLLQEKLRTALFEPKAGVFSTFNHYYRDHLFVAWIAAFERYPKRYARWRSVQAANDVGLLWRPRDMLMYRRYWSRIVRETRQPVFGDTSTFYLGCYLDEYAAGEMEAVFDAFRALFAGRRILFVGPETPMGGASFRDEMPRLKAIGLRDGDFMAIPATDAFEHYEAILSEIRRRRKGFDDIFIQAGPAATVAAYELAGTTAGRVIDAGSLNTQIRYLAEPVAAEPDACPVL